MISYPIIESLLDTDLYKFTMWQPFLHQFPGNDALYRFVCRNETAYPLSQLAGAVEEQVRLLCQLRFTEDELAYLSTRPYFKKDFIDFLRIFRFQERYVKVASRGDELIVEARGPQIHVMGFEIYLLAIINELYFERLRSHEVEVESERRLEAKVALLKEHQAAGAAAARPARHPFQVFDFGTRRRYSGIWHQHVVKTLAERCGDTFRGTSNVFLAKKYNLAAMGTMAHEYLQTYQAVGVQLRQFQKAALEGWVQEYRGDLGVALTDVVGMDAFLKDFDLYFAKLFDGLRHDSGDPVVWGEKAIAHYQKLRIDSHTKRLVFSDSLDIPRALALHGHFADRIACGFGIGTNLTNDVGLAPLNIVMKLVECNGQPVAKLSDTPGKSLHVDETFVAYLRQVFSA